MRSHASLRRRLVIGVVCFTATITTATTLMGLRFDEQAERHVWEAMFRSAEAHPSVGTPEGAQGVRSPFLAFGATSGKPVPAEFSGLAPGIHEDIRIGARTYIIDVQGSLQAPVVTALDITDMERREERLDLDLLASGAVAVLLLIASTYMAARWLVRPLAKLSTIIGDLQTGARGQRIEVQSSDPSEVVVIADAVNAYLRDIDGYVEREHRFLNMASHEIRTPLAVIAGAAEVAYEQQSMESARLHISRIVAATHDMRDLVELLLALARDPRRLQSNGATASLAEVIPKIVAYHEHLLEGKDLKVVVDNMPACDVSLPQAIAVSVIGNLLRNAIENAGQGVITMSIEDNETLVIAGPGSTLSPEARSQLQSRLARAGIGRGDGIGLELVERLCRHVGWALELGVSTTGSTTARLGLH
ncbi:sensor histidine kinase [Dyella amyloliquefaciens]|uniref:sensor histidine kinase n=1 Tax=Dyella amyloliquefaciens TaxID=1770545 RepID=UPI00102E7CEC|nr:HAMP domain-containing sensor histidine kinase [Dyella amyloliquefaciens]